MAATGTVAPGFTLADQHDSLVRLADLRGRTVVLSLHPEAEAW